MKIFKKATAGLLALCSALTCASCGENTATAMTVDGYDVRAGIYLYYVTSAYLDAINTATENGESFDDAAETKDIKKILQNRDIDNITAEQWIQNKAAGYCTDFVAVEREFEQLGLSLTGDELAAIDSQTASNMVYYGDFYESAGIGEQSVKDIIANNYKQEAVWDAYYGEGGLQNIDEQALYDYYAENNLRIKYIEMPLKDGEGNDLDDAGIKVIKEMAEDYMTRLGKKQDSEKALMEEFDYLIEENANYQTSISEAAVTTTDEEGNTITTETTAKATTDENGNSDVTTAPEDTDDEETTETTTTAPAEDAEETEETTETTVTADTEATETTTTTTVTETTETDDSYSYDNERVLAVSTSATAAEGENAAETTTTEPSYTPCKAVYDWAADSETPYLEPELIEDEDCIYIVCKMDITKRMTSDDLWTSSQIETVRQSMYYDEFLDLMQDKADALTTVRNEKAFKRYKVLDVDVVGYQNAWMQSYYSMYGGA